MENDSAARVRGGDVRALARLITGLENGDPTVIPVMRALAGLPRHAQVVGVTGPPGSGKSTLVDKLIAALRQRGARVGVLAVDPSSPFTGGAILGDRLRMQSHATDDGVFIRSLASRGRLGGISQATQAAARAMDAAGYDFILIETVGVGQSEVDVVRVADTVILVAVPGLGDDIQVIKAGIMEIGDVFVVNKADRDGADRVVREIRTMLETAAALKRGSVPDRAVVDTLAGRPSEGHGAHHPAAHHADVDPHAFLADLPPVVKTVAETGEGVEALLDLVVAHYAKAEATGALAERRLESARAELASIVNGRVAAALATGPAAARGASLAQAVAGGTKDVYGAAEELVAVLVAQGLGIAREAGG
jgi:LAO/AO transport system kinase